MAVSRKEKKWIAKGTVIRSDGSRKYYQRSFDLKRDAIAYENLRRKQLSFEQNDELELDLYAKMTFIKEKNLIKEGTIEFQKQIYYAAISPKYGMLKLSQITAPMLLEWQNDLMKTMKVSSVKTYRAIFSKLLSSAEREMRIRKNPFEHVPPPKEPNKLPEESQNFWTKEEYETFLSYETDETWRFIWELLWHTGLRKSEAAALQWKHYKNGKLKVCQNFDGRHRLTSPKTKNSIRTIVLSDHMISLLNRRLEFFQTIDGFSEEWFITRDWRSWSKIVFQKHLDAGIQKAGVKRITVHGLRHSHASLLINSDVPDVLIADRMGHTITMLHSVYGHLYDDKKESLKEVLNEIL